MKITLKNFAKIDVDDLYQQINVREEDLSTQTLLRTRVCSIFSCVVLLGCKTTKNKRWFLKQINEQLKELAKLKIQVHFIRDIA